MSIDPLSVAAGAVVGSIATDALEKTKAKAAEATGNASVQHGTIEDQMLVEMVGRIEHAIHQANANKCDPQFVKQVLYQSPYSAGYVGSGTPYRVKRAGYKHVSLLTATAFTAVIQTEVGTIQFAMNAGWNAFDVPNETDVWIASGGPASVAVIFYYGDDSLDITGV